MSENTEVSGKMKTSFSQRCSMISQYLKENGSFGDLTLGMSNGTSEMFRQNGTTATTMNLFPVMEKPRDLKFMNLFPQQTRSDAPKMTGLNSVNKAESQSQMTIFYGGQVIVLNDFPAEKAKEVMLLASQESSRNQLKSVALASKTPMESSGSVPQSPNITSLDCNKAVQAPVQPPPRPIVSDLPIARKASLHRFLEKRKDRINSKAPYQITNCPEIVQTKPETESRSWLGLGAQFTQ